MTPDTEPALPSVSGIFFTKKGERANVNTSSYTLIDPVTRAEILRRKTFAIISHPDAGKTTLTEKLLLYCGAIHEAGEVSAKANRRKTVSDWMALERERGISVSSSVLQFDYKGTRVNLLDTPGHQDFSEDTYRTLMAADSAVMVIDAAKGVEPQTIKLFEVCRMRGIPIFTFFNKMDREARDTFELLEEVERVLGIAWHPMVWPIGSGERFRGIYHLLNKEFHFFEPAEKAGLKAKSNVIKCAAQDKILLDYVDEDQRDKFLQELELIEGALPPFDQEAFNHGKVTAAIFGSARNNFGLEVFLDLFHNIAPGPQDKQAKPQSVHPDENRFSGFIFKIQANMDKAHRDRIAFLRICSGKFERDMNVKSSRLDGKTIRLAHAKQFLAQDRTTVDAAYAGDIVGIHDPGHFMIGDTLYTGQKIEFSGIPQFSPERFARVRLKDPMKRKQFQKGVQQLCEEGMVQMFVQPHVGAQDPVLGVVGSLQFDVMMFRLKDEYGVDAILDTLPFAHARWILNTDPKLDIKSLDLRVTLVQDIRNHWVALFNTEWEFNYTVKNAPQTLKWFTSSYELENQN